MDEMDEMEMDEPFLDPPSQLQARPASAPTGISSPADLQPDTIYCDSQDVLERVNLTDSQFPLKDAAKVVVPHTLSLELLHYFGPFFTGTRTNYVYVANFENDNSHVVLISHWTDAKETAQMDFYLNRIFKIQNFLTINSKGIHFDCGNIECVIAEKPLHDIAIVVNETLNSTLEFNESFRELTKLSEVINPSNKVQAFNFVNVIGFVEAFSRTNKADILLISDEETKNFRVYLGYCQLDQLKQNPLQSDVEKMFFSSSDRSVVYPPLKKGDLVCIRDLCLGSGPINIVVHPDQLYVIKPYKSNVILQDNTFSGNEIERIHKLLTEFANIKVQNPVPYKISNHDILDFCGLVLAKLEYPPVNNKSTRVELFLLLPYKSSLPTYLTEKTGYIVNYISSKCSTELNIYNQEIINELVERNRIVTVTLYGVNAQSAESVNIYHQVLLVNVHLKKDLYFSGFYQLIMHDGQDNGKGCFVIDNDSILGEKVSKSIKELNQEVFLQSPLNYMSEEDLNQNFDEEIVNRYNGPENLNAVAESQQKQSSLYKNSFRDIVQASIKKTSLKGQQAVIRCYINEQISMRVNSFAEMVEEIQKGLETTIVVGQNAERDGTPFPPKSFFLVSARMVNYIFEDDLGLPITDMHTFRRSLIKFYCKIPKCDNRASYLSVAPQISRIIASGDDHPDTSIRCSKCGENSMGLYLTLKFTIEDSFGQKFTCLLTSPEAEEFIGVTSQQLMFTSPRSGDICNAVESLLQTFCPYRRPLSRTPEGSLNSSSASNDPPLVPLNPKLEWIIQYARKEDANESISADFLNGHMFDLNSTVNGTPIRHFFYIRGISELSPP